MKVSVKLCSTFAENTTKKSYIPNLFFSCLYIKRRQDLISAFSITPSYLRNDFSTSGLVTDYRDWQIPLGRRFRALKIWFVLRTYGVTGLKAHVRNHINLGVMFHSLVCSRPDLFRILTAPAFALTVLTVLAPLGSSANGVSADSGIDKDHHLLDSQPHEQQDDRANMITKHIYETINAAGEIFLTSTVVKGVYAIRVVSANALADESHLRNAFAILVRTTEETLKAFA